MTRRDRIVVFLILVAVGFMFGVGLFNEMSK